MMFLFLYLLIQMSAGREILKLPVLFRKLTQQYQDLTKISQELSYKKTSPWKPKLPKPQLPVNRPWPLRKSWSKNLPTVSRFQSYPKKTTSRWYLNHPVEKYVRNLDPSSQKKRVTFFQKNTWKKISPKPKAFQHLPKGAV